MAKILVVDDVDLERMAAAMVLKKRGHEVIEAVNGLEGIEMARLHLPDLIFMDIVMSPGLDGFSATKRLRIDPVTRNIPIVILSSKAQPSDKFRAEHLGARAYVVKPVTNNVIAPILDKLLAR